MGSSAPNSYLVTEVMTATPQKLQLMLIEAAIRSAQRARQKWQDNEDDRACEALVNAQQVVSELLASLNREVDADLVGKVASVYMFVFRNLMEANHEHDEKKLDDAIRVLQLERETWRQVCRQLGSSKPPDNQAAAVSLSEQSTASQSPPLPGSSPGPGAVDDPPASGLSLEA